MLCTSTCISLCDHCGATTGILSIGFFFFLRRSQRCSRGRNGLFDVDDVVLGYLASAEDRRNLGRCVEQQLFDLYGSACACVRVLQR